MIGSAFLRGLRRFFCIGSAAAHESETVAVIEQSLRDTSELFKTQLNKTKALRTELQYIYHIFLRRNKCNFKLEFAAGPHFLLFTTERDASGINLVVYIPRENAEIAEVYAHPLGSDLVIDSIKLGLPFCDARFGQLLLQELVAEARAKGLRRIMGRIGKPGEENIECTARFCTEAGFEVRLAGDGITGEMVYELEACS